VKPSLQKRILKKLDGFAPAPDFGADDIYAILTQAKDRISRDTFPVPRLLRFLFSSVLGFPEMSRLDKMHWCLVFRYRGHLCFLADGKFGLRFYHAESAQIDLTEVYRRINSALRLVENELLAPAAQAALASGDIIVTNHFKGLDSRYPFFRKLAETRRREFRPRENTHQTQMISHLFRVNPAADAALAHYNYATIDAYFSRLEHFLVLAFAFGDFAPGKDDIRPFIGSDWGDKFRRVFPLSDATSKVLYDRLHSLKESFRNPLTHGGFEKGGTSFSFQHPDAGRLPVVLSGISESPRFSLSIGTHATFETATALFDECDSWFQDVAASKAWTYAMSGLDLQFDAAEIQHLRSLSQDALAEWIEETHERIAVYRNADY
jgi:hypothetical protein